MLRATMSTGPRVERPDPGAGAASDPAKVREAGVPGLLLRGGLGGALMGVANLVPGISGGTMLLATGIYPRFVAAIAELSTLRLRIPSLITLASVAGSALVAVFLLAGPVKDVVILHRWIAYSLFIGLTLGGVPVLWRMIGKGSPSVFIGAAAGIVAMAAVVLLQEAETAVRGEAERSLPLLVASGIGGASAMVLPGISGGYVVLILGQYVPILGAIEDVRAAVSAGDLGAATTPFLQVVLPVGVGVVIGLVVVSNVVKILLERYRRPTLGVLLGLLLGAVVGLWPFRAPVTPEPGDIVAGEALTAEAIVELDPESWPTVTFTPSAAQLGGSAALILLGFALTSGVAWIGRLLEDERTGTGIAREKTS
jgi:putative membrane protein